MSKKILVMKSYKQILESRNNYRNGKARGFEWEPVKMPFTKLDQYEDGVEETISKILALSLELELPVGEWIAQASKKELDISDYAQELLLSNIADETVHYKAIKLNSENYVLPKDILEAHNIYTAWDESNIHPIEKACFTEVAIFLIGLANLRIFGGESLATLAANISKDENRHVATNRGILRDLNYDFKNFNSVKTLIDQTLDWMLSDLTVSGLDKEFFMQQSDLLVHNGYAPELNELTDSADDISPFESPNYILY